MSRILLTCGAGDFIALESFLTLKERCEVTEIFWATRARSLIEQLVPWVFPNVIAQTVVRDTWGDDFQAGFCVHSASELSEGTPTDVVDLNIDKVVTEARAGYRRYRGSSLALAQLASISHLDLPERYFVVHPYSQNARTEDRDLSHDEWALACRLLRAARVPVVVVNQGDDRYKSFPGVIDLTDKLSFLEALEVTRRASGFIGAASVFSVLAAKNLTEQQLFVKGNPSLKRDYSWFYYAPHSTNNFVNGDLKKVLPRISKLYPKERALKVHTVQGIGDIFWVYQKLAPHVDSLHLNVLCSKFGDVELRSREFCKLLPKVKSVTFSRVAPETYQEVATDKYHLSPILEAIQAAGEGDPYVPPLTPLGNLSVGSEVLAVPYSVNVWLERGTNLYEIDNLAVERFVDLGLNSEPQLVPEGRYLCVFVAGAKNDKVWPPSRWVRLIERLLADLKLNKVVLVGATWDAPVQAEVERELVKKNIAVESYVGELDLVDSVEVIRGAKFFLGYQSGLNIIAENYDVPQLMVYFDQLRDMLYTWCKPESRERTFFAMTFSDPLPDLSKIVLS